MSVAEVQCSATAVTAATMNRPTLATAVRAAPPKLETTGWAVLLMFVAAVQFSIAASAFMLTGLLVLWVSMLVVNREQLTFPFFFWPLVAYALWTMVSVGFSIDPMRSLVDSKEVLLFLVVPAVYRLARGERAANVATVVITVGAVAAVLGIVQYGIFEYDNLGQRPRGAMGHYMTYSGLLMLVIVVTASRILFARSDRIWAALVLPALIVALALTLTRSAWVGTCAGVSLLFILKDLRLLAVAPVVAAVFFALAPPQITNRVYATFDLQDPTNRDRLAMVSAGAEMVLDHPVTGVGPEMVQVVYADYRVRDAVNETNPHLHNVPLQIAAERGVPALVLWIWFVVAVISELLRRLRAPASRALAAGGLAAVTGMLAAGMFEYNFGDSEFLMLLLVLITLPAAAAEKTIPA